MGETLSAEQVRERHLRDMGLELGSIYNALTNDITWLHAKWNQYRQLFARSPERIAVLNKAGGYFFGIIQDTLFEDVVLHITRLTDPPRSVGKDNLTLQRFPELLTDSRLAAEVQGLIDAAITASDKARVWRNRRLAHRDLSLAKASTSDPLPGISRADIETALRATRDVVLRLEDHYWHSQTGYEHVAAGLGDASAVVYYLHKGIRMEEKRMERLRQHRPLPEDLQPEPEV